MQTATAQTVRSASRMRMANVSHSPRVNSALDMYERRGPLQKAGLIYVGRPEGV
jgi:hypothetical protein